MATILLVHGAFHGAWCWDAVVPELERTGHRVLAIDLPGHGARRDVPFHKITLDLYAGAIVDAARELGEPVFAVGHSNGSFAISHAHGLAPERFTGLCHLAGMVPMSGERATTLSVRVGGFRVRPMRLGWFSGSMRARDVIPTFYNTCDPETAERAAARLTPQPLLPGIQPARCSDTPPPFRGYIATRRDQTYPFAGQKRVAARFRIDAWAELDTGHSPFLCSPFELAGEIGRMATGAEQAASRS